MRADLQIRTIDRKQEVPHDGAMCDLLWSDPEDIEVTALPDHAEYGCTTLAWARNTHVCMLAAVAYRRRHQDSTACRVFSHACRMLRLLHARRGRSVAHTTRPAAQSTASTQTLTGTTADGVRCWRDAGVGPVAEGRRLPVWRRHLHQLQSDQQGAVASHACISRAALAGLRSKGHSRPLALHTFADLTVLS